ncbi:MAG: NADPH-dependent F420 reductase [Acidimicrobiales bacterium]
MQVGILGGTGPAGRALAARIAATGAPVAIGSRDEARAASVAKEIRELWPDRKLEITGATNDWAAKSSSLIIHATVYEAAAETAARLARELSGKVLISIANGMSRVGGELQAVVPARGSIAATLQGILPDTKVAAAFHHLPAKEFADIAHPIESDVLICADDEEAAEATVTLVESIPGLRALRAGSLASAGAVEALTAVLVNVNVRYRCHTTLHLMGVPVEPGPSHP